MSTFFKRPKTWVAIALLAATAVTLSAWVVRHSQQKRCVDIPNSVYYWKTSFFPLDSNEKAFLTGNSIRRIYVRFFDVELNWNGSFHDTCAPVGSIGFYPGALKYLDSLQVEIVPVVFITPEAVKAWRSFSDNLAHRLYAMCRYKCKLLHSKQRNQLKEKVVRKYAWSDDFTYTVEFFNKEVRMAFCDRWEDYD